MPGTIRDVTALADRLIAAGIHFTISVNRTESVMFSVVVPGERWEIELLADGTVQVELFRSDGEIWDDSKLQDLFDRFTN